MSVENTLLTKGVIDIAIEAISKGLSPSAVQCMVSSIIAALRPISGAASPQHLFNTAPKIENQIIEAWHPNWGNVHGCWLPISWIPGWQRWKAVGDPTTWGEDFAPFTHWRHVLPPI